MMTNWVSLDSISYLSWFSMAIKTSAISIIVVVLINFMFYHDMIREFSQILKKKGRNA